MEHIKSWNISNSLSSLNNVKLHTLLKNACILNEASMTFLLNNKNTPKNPIESVVDEIFKFHTKRLNTEIDDQVTVEFWFKTSSPGNINNFHIDCDEYDRQINKSDDYNVPLISCITYLNDNTNVPTVITDVNNEMYKFKDFSEAKSLCISLPRNMKHVSFNGGKYYHGTSQLCETNDKQERYILIVNIWKEKPLNVPYFDYEYFLFKYAMRFKQPIDIFQNDGMNILEFGEDVVTTINLQDVSLLSADFYEKLLYSNVVDTCFKFKNLIQFHVQDNPNTSTFVFTMEPTKKNKMRKNEKIDVRNIAKFQQRLLLKNVFSPDVCKWIVNESEEYANNNNGWTTARHNLYPTTDLPLELMKSPFKFALISFKETFAKEIARYYGLGPATDYEIKDLFIIKYEKDQDKQSKLDLHTDIGCLTINILLSDPMCDFKGGGTFFEDGITTHLTQGDLIVHSSQTKHAGVEITEGRRYVLVFFIDIFE